MKMKLVVSGRSSAELHANLTANRKQLEGTQKKGQQKQKKGSK